MIGISLSVWQQTGAGGGGPPAFSPAVLFAGGEQGVWFDPSPSTCFTDTARTTPAAVGQAVAGMTDLSGRGNHATQATVASQPILRQSGALYYLEFDGVDDFMVTGSIDFTGTDKISTFTGARKNNDTLGLVAELSATTNSNTGAFAVVVNDGTRDWSTFSRGDAAVSAGQGAFVTIAGADTAVITSNNDIAANLTTIRRNGVAGADATGNKGVGNFGNYPFYIGRRGGTTLPLNGNLYSFIARGALTTGADFTSTEAYVAGRTGVTLP
jgi:hypothetical protein